MLGQPIHALTAVWGAWHLRAFLELALPTLLEPGNLPALLARHPVSWRIWTRAGDVAQLRAAPSYRRLAALLPVTLKTLRDDAVRDPIATHVRLWKAGFAGAANAGALAFPIAPDLVWGSGSLDHLADLVAQGKRAICAGFPRAASETFIPALRLHLREADEAVALPSRLLMRLCLQHLHPLMRAYQRGSTHFPTHPEMILWPVARDPAAKPAGFAARVLVREMALFDPQRVRLNAAMLPEAIDPAELHMVADSDDLFGVSLAPADKDAAWYELPRRLQPGAIARWWLDYDSPANDLVARTPVRWHADRLPDGAWAAAEAAGGLLIEELLERRETLRRRLPRARAA